MTVDYAARLAAVRSRIDDAARLASRSGEEIKLIAVSKYASIDQVVAAYAAGQRDFGENYLQDAIAKIEAVIERLGADAIEHDPPRWHMIGQLQSNKAARVATVFDYVHALASSKAARAMSRELVACGESRPVLLQIHLGGGEERGGLAPAAAHELLHEVSGLGGLVVAGVMGVAPLGEDPRPHFCRLREIRDDLRANAPASATLDEISAGMSADYEDAIAEGATMVRVGGAIFADGPP
jgi:pyridoxal phosphate enzyme (YggS family)